MRRLLIMLAALLLCDCAAFSQETRRLRVPTIPALEEMDFEELQNVLELEGAKDAVDCICWPGRSAYQPSCVITIARSATHLAILFHNRGMDLRATALRDNEPIWEDSCCEFFIEEPGSQLYHNLEINCIGTLLKQKGSSLRGREKADSCELAAIRRFSSLPKERMIKENAIFEWTAAMVIPFKLLGIDPSDLPEKVRANFYKCGEKTAHPHYLSWNPVRTGYVSFHEPEFFGELILK